MAIQRQIAYKVWIGDLLGKKLVKALGEWEPNYLEIKDLKVSRVNLVATIVDKFGNDTGYGTLMIDDGSGNIRVRAWQDETKLFDDISVGDVIIIIGRVKDYTEEIYVSPEIIKKLDSDWLKLRQKELEFLYGLKEISLQVNNKIDVVDIRGKVMDIIKDKDSGLGVDVSLIIDTVGDCEVVINDMIENGEIFYVKPGFLKLMV